MDSTNHGSEHKQDHKSDDSSNSRWRRCKHRAAVIGRFSRKEVKKIYKEASVFLGLRAGEPQQEQKADIAAYLAETKQQINSLPNNYLRHFDMGSGLKKNDYEGINEYINHFKNAKKQRDQGLSSAIAVVGEKGSGKSTCLKLICREFFVDKKILNIHVNERLYTEEDLLGLFSKDNADIDFSSVEKLATFLNKNHSGNIILFEDIQQVFLRNLHGYEAIEKLIYLIAETRKNIFWVISCSRYAWAFLDKTFSLGNYFSSVIATDQLNDDQIEDLITSRHSSSRFSYVFASSKREAEKLMDENLSDEEQKKQQELRNKFFKKLTKIAEGNASVAIIFWFRSLNVLDGNRCFIVPSETSSLKILDDADPEILFVLATLIMHPLLQVEGLAMTQHVSANESYTMLKRLEASGMVTHTKYGYEVNHLLYRQIVRELKNRNILHL